VSGGLITLWYTDPDAFRAVLLHELGHLRNRDVDRTYFTMALWYAFLSAAVAPFLISIADQGADIVWPVLWRLAALVALVYLTRNAVLRSRELYADLRSDVSGGAAAIRRVIASNQGEVEPRRAAGLLRLHPDPSERVAALADTERLFRLGKWEAFAAGIVLTLVFHELSILIGFYEQSPLAQQWLAALLVAPFVAGVVVLGVWRATFAAVLRGGGLHDIVPAGLALGLGALAGEALSFQHVGKVPAHPTGVTKVISDLAGFTPQNGIVSSDLFGPGVLWAVVVVASMLLFTLWIAACAKLWLRRGGERAPRTAAVATVAAAAAVLTVWTGAFFVIYDLTAPAYRLFGGQLGADAARIAQTAWLGSEGLYRVVMDPQTLYMAQRWPVLPTLTLLWAFPLAAALRVRGVRRTSSWAFLDRDPPAILTPERVQLKRAATIGLCAGLSALAACLTLRLALHAGVDAVQRQQNDFVFAFYYWNVSLVLVAQAVAAGVAAASCATQRVLSALFAAFVAGVIGAVAVLLGPTAASCVDAVALNPTGGDCPFWVTRDFVRQVFQQVLVEGAIVALAATGMVMLARAGRSRLPLTPGLRASRPAAAGGRRSA
jgi:hypothetical protein